MITTDPSDSDSVVGINQLGTVAGSIQRDGTGGNPRSASLSPATSAGSASTHCCSTDPSGPQHTTGRRCPLAGATSTAASARGTAASRTVAAMHRSRFSDAIRTADASSSTAARSRSRARSTCVCLSTASGRATSHQATCPSGSVVGCAVNSWAPMAPRNSLPAPASAARKSRCARANQGMSASCRAVPTATSGSAARAVSLRPPTIPSRSTTRTGWGTDAHA